MKARWPLLAGGVLLAGAVALILWLQYAPLEPLQLDPGPAVAAAPAAPPRPGPPPARAKLAPLPMSAHPAPPPPESPPPPPPGAPPPVEGPSGIGLFPAPGTKQIKRGIIVPEGFELPKGYVRHYQTTDDGQRLPAILMYSPYFTPKDGSGVPIQVPEDRIVPPEKAPKGIPIQYLDPPRAEGDGG